MPRANETIVTSSPGRTILALPIGTSQSSMLRHLAFAAIEHFVFEDEDGVGIADRGFQQALGIGRVRGGDDLEAGDVGIPGGIALRVLGCDAGGCAVGAAEDDRAAHLAARHVKRLGGRVDDLVDRLHGEVPGHELDDRLQAREGRADADAGKALFGDRRVDHALGAELVEQALADLVGALVLGDFLAHQEDIAIAAHLFGHRVAQRFAHGDLASWRCRRARRVRARFRGRARRSSWLPAAPGPATGDWAVPAAAGAGSLAPLVVAAAFGDIARGLALAQDDGDRRVDLYAFGAFIDEDFVRACPRRRLRLPSSPCRFRSRR